MRSIVLYSSKYGTTQSVAKKIAEELNCEYISLDQKNHVDLSQYDQIILGTSVYMGRMRKPIFNILNNEQDLLNQKRTTLYFCCNQETDYKALVPNTLKNLDIVHVGFELRTDQMRFLDKFITKKVAKQSEPVYKLNQEAINQLISDAQ